MKKTIEIEIPDGYKEKVTNAENGVIVEFIKEDKNKEMKEFLLSWINGSEIFITDKYSDFIFYKKNGEVVFEYNSKNDYFWVEYYKIWSVFYDKFGLNYDETQTFIKSVVEDTLKLRSIAPKLAQGRDASRWKTL